MNKLIFISGIAIGLLLGTSNLVWADLPSVNPRPRMESMGGAGVAALGDKDSAMMNPAGLADVQKGVAEVFPLLIEVPLDISDVNSFKDYNDVRTNDSSTTAQKRDAFTNFMRDLATTATAVRVNFYPSYTRKYFHVGLLGDFYADPRLRLGGFTSNQVVELGGSTGTVGVIGGAAYTFLDNSLEVGMTLKPLYRIAATKNQEQTVHDVILGKNAGDSIPDELFGSNKGDNRGFGVGADLGVKYFIPYLEFLKPAVGMTWQDLGDTRFFTDSEVPSDIQQSISIGAAINPKWAFTKNTFSFDVRNINKSEDFWNKLHLGVESVLWNFFAIRAGLSQGYFTGGLGFDFKFLEMDFYAAAKEAGQYNHIQPIHTLGVRIAAAF